MKIFCNAGLGDIIGIINFLTQFKTHEFSLHPKLFLCDIYREGRGKVFTRDLIEWLCHGSNTIPVYDTDLKSNLLDGQFKSFSMLINLAKECRLKIKYPSSFLVNKLTRVPDFDNKIVVTTKVRGCSTQQVYQILLQVLPYLQMQASNVVILGVQKCPECYEYTKPGNQVISLYQQLKNALPKAVDMTNSALDNLDSKLQDFIYDLNIMVSARKVLTFGHGGNTVMGQFNSNCISFVTNSSYKFYEQIFYGNKLVHTIQEFMKNFNAWKLI